MTEPKYAIGRSSKDRIKGGYWGYWVYDENAVWHLQNYPGISTHRDRRAAERAIARYKKNGHVYQRSVKNLSAETHS